MTIDDKIRDEKVQYDIYRKQQKYWRYHLEKLITYEYLTVEEILLPSDQSRIIEQAKFKYSPGGKAFEKQIKKIEDQGEEQVKALEEHGKQVLKQNKPKANF